jgi:hypothetical protein
VGTVDPAGRSIHWSLDLPAGDCRVSVLDARGIVLSERPVTLGSETTVLEFAR